MVPDGGTIPDGQVESPDDPAEFMAWATDRGWGDGLPLIPPTPERVARFTAAADRPADSVLLEVPPANAWCTVEKLAINACMAGAAPEAMPLMMAALEAMAERPFDLFALNTTTSSVSWGMRTVGPSGALSSSTSPAVRAAVASPACTASRVAASRRS